MVPKKNVSVIVSKNAGEKNTVKRKKRTKVAAYCRVSTDEEEQESSYEAQVSYYTEKISLNPEWEFVGIYADDGISGTNTKKRDDFNTMVKDALNGKIDIIMTKSVSRFARNTVDSLTTIRKLKEKNVAVIFETQNINTLDGSGELLITILSSLAQEESRNISKNVRWGITRRFENGKVRVNHNKFLGYTKDADGELVIVPEEAEIVKLIFRLYLEGNSAKKITQYLKEHEIKTVTGKDDWHDTVIYKMLRNEKYMGDALLQKTYTADFMTKKRCKNNGNVPQYYVENDHEAIIPKELFFRVQEELVRRSSINTGDGSKKQEQRSRYSGGYALTGILVCGECGQEYRRATWVRNGTKRIVWRCSNRLSNGTKYCKESPSLEEKGLQQAVMASIGSVAGNKWEFVEAFRQNVIRVIGNYQQEQLADEYEPQIREKQREMFKLIEANADIGYENAEFEEKYNRISEEILSLKNQQTEQKKRRVQFEEREERIKKLDEFLKGHSDEQLPFDNDLVRRLISKIKVISAEKLQIQFHSGIVMEQMIYIEKKRKQKTK